MLDINYARDLHIIKTKFLAPPPKDFVAVVFISNKTIKHTKPQDLADKILKSLNKLNYKELQIDCDWTLLTRYNYFLLLSYLKKKIQTPLSATIRLHQVKYYAKTGVPPVDYGVLMYYNISSIGLYKTKNSILDNVEARKYHHNFNLYKLRLKLALPLYSQGVWFRDKKPLGIFEGLNKSDFNKFFDKIDENFYKAKKSFYFKGRYVYKDDIIRFEDVSLRQLKQALKDFFGLAKNPFKEVIFYTYKYKNKFDLERLIKEF